MLIYTYKESLFFFFLFALAAQALLFTAAGCFLKFFLEKFLGLLST
jgi:hypothetical protein